MSAPIVQLWQADLDGTAGRPPAGVLSPDERDRAAQISSARVRMRWQAARATLRVLLAQQTGVAPDALVLRVDEAGKLLLADGAGFFKARPSGSRSAGSRDAEKVAQLAGTYPRAGGEGLFFNVSHSGHRLVCALAWGVEVGVDVELVRRSAAGERRDEVALAARALGRRTADRLSALEQPARHEAFLREWVAHEAYLKCLGVGLAGASEPPPAAAVRPQVWVGEVDAGPGAVAALAVRGAVPPEVLPRTYPGDCLLAHKLCPDKL